MSEPIHVANFYCFSRLPGGQLVHAKRRLEQWSEELSLTGLVILAEEGINGTVAGLQDAVERFKRLLPALFAGEWSIKDGTCTKNPFKRFRVKVRREIVTTWSEAPIDVPQRKNALTPEQWHELLISNEPYQLIDVRNWYEVELGRFCGAIDPRITNFQQFAEFIEEAQIPTDTKILMYCTGGIRCEKAIYDMEQRGYKSVFQLEGGILNYLKEYPWQLFKGECFVFDHRVAVTQELRPTETYAFCPHCGQPGDIPVECGRCGTKGTICRRCEPQEFSQSCSKDCRNQLMRLPQCAGAGGAA